MPQITIPQGKSIFKVSIKQADPRQYSVNVFVDDEKLPIFGSRFSIHTPIESVILNWVKDNIEAYTKHL